MVESAIIAYAMASWNRSILLSRPAPICPTASPVYDPCIGLSTAIPSFARRSPSCRH